MKPKWALVAIVGMALLGCIFWFTAFRDKERHRSADVAIPPSRDSEGDLITAGRSVSVESEINGDLAAAGAQVMVAAPIRGYLLVGGSNVSVNGDVGNDLWAAGSDVQVSGSVSDNAMVAGNSVILRPQGSVGRDAYLAGQSVEVRGRVGRNLRVAAAEVTLASEVGGSVNAHAGSLRVLPGAVIRGNLAVRGPNPPDVSPKAQVLGRVEHHPEGGWSVGRWIRRWVSLFLALNILGLATLSLSAWWANRVAEKVTGRPGYALLVGLLVLILTPLVCVLLAITVVGIPLAIVLIALYGVALLLSGVFVSYQIGRWLLERRKGTGSPAWAHLALGALLLTFLATLPWIGWLVRLLVVIFGVGALFLERRDSWWRMRAESPA